MQASTLELYTIAPICTTCGTMYPPGSTPAHCAICEDERQYVAAEGQRWTTLRALRAEHTNAFEDLEEGITSIHTTPSFAIAQRAFLVRTPSGNVLWDCLNLVDDASVARIRERGGVQAIAVSHPHFYASMAAWSAALGDCPIYIHEKDAGHVHYRDPRVQFWRGDRKPLFADLSLVHTGGHFDGYQVLHWRSGAGGRGVLFAGDTPFVNQDARWVSFMHSYPNYISLGIRQVEGIARCLSTLRFDRLYGAFARHPVCRNAGVIYEDAYDVVQRSAARCMRAMQM